MWICFDNDYKKTKGAASDAEPKNLKITYYGQLSLWMSELSLFGSQTPTLVTVLVEGKPGTRMGDFWLPGWLCSTHALPRTGIYSGGMQATTYRV